MRESSRHHRSVLLVTALLVCGLTAVGAAAAEQAAHPAVARIIVPDGSGVSFGSGTLVAVDEQQGLVVTNWHVVRDAAEKIVVMFPGGFTSEAKLLKVNRDWDLAALSIKPPPDVPPVPLSSTVPRRGDVLAIAGWGKGSYRTTAGRCTQYLSPGGNHPFELLELTTAARNGDSGGPIFNQRGELAGVLFGSAFGRTTGSYCGRVQWFLATVDRRFQQDVPRMPAPYRPPARPGVPPEETLIAERREQRSPVAAIGGIRPVRANVDPPRSERPAATAIAAQLPPQRQTPPAPLPPAAPPVSVNTPPPAASPLMESPEVPVSEFAVSELPAAEALTPDAPSPHIPTRGDQLKTVLAGIGIMFLLFHGLRFIGGLQQ